jgi:hypothetical protein
VLGLDAHRRRVAEQAGRDHRGSRPHTLGRPA